MFLLDANVLSEMQKTKPNAGLVSFLRSTPASQLFISSVTLSELSYGINRLSKGKKQTDLLANLTSLRTVFSGRILPYTEDIAIMYGGIMANQEKQGFNDDVFDTMLIAHALTENMTIVTRNEKYFKNRTVQVVNPFT